MAEEDTEAKVSATDLEEAEAAAEEVAQENNDKNDSKGKKKEGKNKEEKSDKKNKEEKSEKKNQGEKQEKQDKPKAKSKTKAKAEGKKNLQRRLSQRVRIFCRRLRSGKRSGTKKRIWFLGYSSIDALRNILPSHLKMTSLKIYVQKTSVKSRKPK